MWTMKEGLCWTNWPRLHLSHNLANWSPLYGNALLQRPSAAGGGVKASRKDTPTRKQQQTTGAACVARHCSTVWVRESFCELSRQ